VRLRTESRRGASRCAPARTHGNIGGMRALRPDKTWRMSAAAAGSTGLASRGGGRRPPVAWLPKLGTLPFRPARAAYGSLPCGSARRESSAAVQPLPVGPGATSFRQRTAAIRPVPPRVPSRRSHCAPRTTPAGSRSATAWPGSPVPCPLRSPSRRSLVSPGAAPTHEPAFYVPRGDLICPAAERPGRLGSPRPSTRGSLPRIPQSCGPVIGPRAPHKSARGVSDCGGRRCSGGPHRIHRWIKPKSRMGWPGTYAWEPGTKTCGNPRPVSGQADRVQSGKPLAQSRSGRKPSFGQPPSTGVSVRMAIPLHKKRFRAPGGN